MKTIGPGDIDADVVTSTILDLIQPILDNMSTLINDMNGTHVIRAAIAVLTGIPVLSERKGKESKHQHSVPLAEPFESIMCPKHFYVNKSKCFSVPDEFHGAYGS